MSAAGERTEQTALVWTSRGYLPHVDSYHRVGAGEAGVEYLTQSITFRLADSLPREMIRRLAAAKEAVARLRGGSRMPIELRRELEQVADAGHGTCWLADPVVAEIVENALLFHDNERYRLISWCIMPNHVHVVIDRIQPWTLAQLTHTWKSFTAKLANRHLGRTGAFWMRDYFDRYIRDAEHLARVVRYIEQNPVKAGLCERPGAWRWGSAYRREAGS